MKNFLLVLIAIVFVSSCTSTKSIKFSQKENDIYTNQNLKSFLAKHKNPKVVLRVPLTSATITDKDDNAYLYNAIENELLSSGFVVRDRQLFNQIIGNNENNINYAKLKQKSDTELIIELSQLKNNVLYETNKYYDANGREKVENEITHDKYGALVEFKVIIVESNEYAGLYRFNYTPCTEPCTVSLSPKDYEKMLKNLKTEGPNPFEGVEKNLMEEFIKDATQKLISEMRK